LLPEYYALCDFFILNSTKAPNGDVEGFGIVLVESGLMGKPVIGTKGCGIVEIIEHNKTGLLIEKDSIKDTTSAIRVLLKDVKLRKSFGQNFYLKAIKTLTWKAVAHNTNNEINSYFAKYSTKN